MTYRIYNEGDSFSFPDQHVFLEQASPDGPGAVFLGSAAATLYDQHADSLRNAPFVLIELGQECLGVHIGDDDGPGNVFGMARFRLGQGEPTALVELVRKSYSNEQALQSAKSALEESGLVVATCQDFPGRILNRLIRPYYNAALRRLDDGLASAKDMDATLRMGLGYPEGPIELLNRTGLEHHYEVTQALFEQLGQEAYAAAPRARTAWLRHKNKEIN